MYDSEINQRLLFLWLHPRNLLLEFDSLALCCGRPPALSPKQSDVVTIVNSGNAPKSRLYVMFSWSATGHDGDGDPRDYDAGYPAMMATMIPRISTRNQYLVGRGEPAMRATVTPWVP